MKFLKLLQHIFRLRLADAGQDGLPGHKPFELLLGHFHDLLLCPGPLVPSIQKPFVEQKKAVALPNEALDLVGPSATEHKQHILLKRIDPKLTADDSTQAVDALAQVRIAAGDIDPVEAGSIIQHGALPAAYDPEPHGLRSQSPECRPGLSDEAVSEILFPLE